MSKERITIFLFIFIIIFTVASGYIYASVSGDEEIEEGKDLGFWSVIYGLKKFTLDVPIVSSGIIAIVVGLGVYVIYREVRGGF